MCKMGPCYVFKWIVFGRGLAMHNCALQGESQLHYQDQIWIWWFVWENGQRICGCLCVTLCLCDVSSRCSFQTADSCQIQKHEERVSKYLTVHYNLWLHQSLHQKMVLDETGKIPHAAVMRSHESSTPFSSPVLAVLSDRGVNHTGSSTTSEPGSSHLVFGDCDQEQRIFF